MAVLALPMKGREVEPEIQVGDNPKMSKPLVGGHVHTPSFHPTLLFIVDCLLLTSTTFNSSIHTYSSQPPEQKKKNLKMLRRKPTAITITPEDLIAFEEERVRQQTIIDQAKQAAANNNSNNRSAEPESSTGFAGKTYDPNDELKPLPGDKAKIVRTRDERIGVSRRT